MGILTVAAMVRLSLHFFTMRIADNPILLQIIITIIDVVVDILCCHFCSSQRRMKMRTCRMCLSVGRGY
jgi:hypothetical protein